MEKITLNEYLEKLQILIRRSDYDSCIDLLLSAIEQYPDEYKLKLNLGNVYKILGKNSYAIELYNSLLRTNYKGIAQNNLSLIMLEEGKLDESILHARGALESNPKYGDAKFNLSLALFEKKKYQESLISCNELLSNEEYKDKAYELKIRINQIICSWDSFDETQELLSSNKITVHPFLHISSVTDEEKNFINARKWNNNLDEKNKINQNFKINKKIKVGFLCGEIRNHPTMYLIKNLFKNLSGLELSMYMFSYDHGVKEKSYIEDSFDNFIDITDLNFSDGYKKIKSYDLDILIDLTTIISHNRIDMLDKNIARVIIAYLAFPGTTGNSVYDYILTDEIVTPKGVQKYYQEKFLYLPDSYQVNNGELNIEIRTKREDYRLPNDAVILGCLNQSFKLDPVFFNIWLDILSKYDNTYLWLLDEGHEMKKNIFHFINNRISSERIIFAEKIDYKDHLQRIQHIDIALDTRIYNGHTTSLEMIQAGVPLVTLKGSHFASRVSTSILKSLGMDELITSSDIEYKNMIISLIDKNYRAEIKNKIIKCLQTSKLLDSRHFSDNFRKTIVSAIT